MLLICSSSSCKLPFAFGPFLSASSSRWCLLCVSYQGACFLHIHLSYPCYHSYISFDILLQILYFFLATAFGTLCILKYSALIFPSHTNGNSNEGHHTGSCSSQ